MKYIVTDRAELKLVEKFMSYADGYLSENITWNDVMPIAYYCSKHQPQKPGEYYYDKHWQKRFAFRLLESSLKTFDLKTVWEKVIGYIEVYNKEK